MTENGQKPKKTPPGGKTEARRQRQAAALRANLRRRKQGGTGPATEGTKNKD